MLNSECLAVVGTRKLTSYGKEAAKKITVGLVRSGFTIVSGLAFGIDIVAHQATIDDGGKTIAVLGGGVSDRKIGPRTNLPVARDILKNDGLLISEYSDDNEVYATNFAMRDRIISGLCKGVLVIEAGEGSGALITAHCALDQNRDVFAVPGSIFSSKSIGPNELITKGAKLVASAQDIIDEYGHNLDIFDKHYHVSTQDPIQKNILDILKSEDELSADEIISHLSAQAGLPAKDTSDILSSLSMLEIKGLIKNMSNGKYRVSK